MEKAKFDILKSLGLKKDTEPVTEVKTLKEIKSLFVIVVIVFAFRSVIFEPFKIPSGSMIPTLMIGDYILVNKFAYGIKVPFSQMYSEPIYLWKFSEPKRGDIIVFKNPLKENINYIKRVVAGPGDRIRYEDKIIYVNDIAISPQQVNEEEAKKVLGDLEPYFTQFDLSLFKENTNGIDHYVLKSKDHQFSTYFFERTIPANKYFVMGDNRDFSADSRFTDPKMGGIGFVDKKLIKGKALMVWFSMNTPLGSFNDHPFRFRWWRIGEIIE